MCDSEIFIELLRPWLLDHARARASVDRLTNTGSRGSALLDYNRARGPGDLVLVARPTYFEACDAFGVHAHALTLPARRESYVSAYEMPVWLFALVRLHESLKSGVRDAIQWSTVVDAFADPARPDRDAAWSVGMLAGRYVLVDFLAERFPAP